VSRAAQRRGDRNMLIRRKHGSERLDDHPAPEFHRGLVGARYPDQRFCEDGRGKNEGVSGISMRPRSPCAG
jgi:hypothetical protein